MQPASGSMGVVAGSAGAELVHFSQLCRIAAVAVRLAIICASDKQKE